MSVWEFCVVAAAGLLAGAVNAIAGGGTLITFPALLWIGVPPVSANITSSVGLVTGYLGGAVGYHRELEDQRARVFGLLAPALVGSALGAATLLLAPAGSFETAVPFMILLSCVLLLAQPQVARRVALRRADSGRRRKTKTGSRGGATDISVAVVLGVFVAATYGSYFGAGLGVLLLALLGMLIDDHLQRLNALKTALSLVVSVVGVAIFLFSGQVLWWAAVLLLVSAYGGGVLGARVARQMNPRVLRLVVCTLGAAVSVVLFMRL